MSDYSDLILAHASLRAYWRLGDANQAAGLQDAGPNNLDGSYPASGVTYGVTGAIANDSDTAVTFDGTASATVPDDNALDLGDGPFSIEFWFKRSATQDAVQVLLAKGTNAPLIRFNGSNVLQMLRNGGASVVNAGTFTDQNVHHAVFTWDGASDSAHAYVDGVDVSSGGDQTETLASTAQVFRIAAVSATQQFYSGTLDDIAIYGAVLSPTEVLEHYEVGSGRIKLEGVSAGVGTASADLLIGRPLAGISQGQGTVSGDLTVAYPLEGSSTGQGTASGAVSLLWNLEGGSSGAGTVAGDLEVFIPLLGSSAGQGAASASLSYAASLEGLSAGQGQADGALGLSLPLVGTSSGVGTAAGELVFLHLLVGTSAGTGTAQGEVTVSRPLAGTSIGQGTASASLTGTWALVGTSAGVGIATGTLRVTGESGPPLFSQEFIGRRVLTGTGMGVSSLGKAGIRRS